MKSFRRDLLSTMLKRTELIAAIHAGHTTPAGLTAQVSISRATVDRALRELKSHDFIFSTGSRYHLTSFGERLWRKFRAFIDDVEWHLEYRDLLADLPVEIQLPQVICRNAKIHTGDPIVPNKPVQKLCNMVTANMHLRWLTPVIPLSVLHTISEHAVDRNLTAQLYLPESVAMDLSTEAPREWEKLTSTASVAVTLLESSPPIGISIADEIDISVELYSEKTLHAVLMGETFIGAGWGHQWIDCFCEEVSHYQHTAL